MNKKLPQYNFFVSSFLAFILSLLLSRSYMFFWAHAWLYIVLMAISIEYLFQKRGIGLLPKQLISICTIFIFVLFAEFLDLQLTGTFTNRYLYSFLVIVLVFIYILRHEQQSFNLILFLLLCFIFQAVSKVYQFAPEVIYHTNSIDQFIQNEGLSYQERMTLMFLGKDLFYINSNEVGYFGVMSMFYVVVYARTSPTSRLIFVLGLLLAFLSRSRASLILGVIIFAIVFGKKRPIFALLSSSLIIFIMIIYSNELAWLFVENFSLSSGDHIRLDAQENALNEIDNALLFKQAYIEYYSKFAQGPHNFFLESIMLYGFIGTFVLIFCIFIGFRLQPIMALVLMIICFFSHNLLSSPIYLSTLICLNIFALRHDSKNHYFSNYC